MTTTDANAPARPATDGIHCGGDCQHLKPYGPESDLTAKCALTKNELIWHDYWVAECPKVIKVLPETL